MKRLILTVFIITVAAGLYAQNNFFPSKVGMVLTYAENDAKGKALAYSVETIKDVKGSGRNMTITYGVTVLDKNRKPPKKSPGEQTFQVVIKDNVVIMDMNQMIPAQLKEQEGVKMEITGTPMELPNSLQPGQSLKDSTITITMDMGFMKINTVMKMTEGKCVAIEDVKTQAGTFKCHKITQKITVTAMNKDTVTTTVSWYAPGIGAVKTETYDDKNKLLASSELVELKGN